MTPKKKGRKPSVESQIEHLQNGLDKALADNESLQNKITELMLRQLNTEQDETVIPLKNGAVGVAVRYAETKDTIRGLVTIRMGSKPELINFNFGYNSGGVTTMGGGPGGEPECP